MFRKKDDQPALFSYGDMCDFIPEHHIARKLEKKIILDFIYDLAKCSL